MSVSTSPKGHEAQGEWQASWSAESLDPEAIERHVASLIPSDEERQGRNFGVHVLDGSDPRSDIGRYIEWQQFEKRFKNDLKRMKELYQPYDGVSTFLMVLDYEKVAPVGVIRIVKPIDGDLITIDEVSKEDGPWYVPGVSAEDRKREMGYEEGSTVDITTMAVMPEYKSGHAEDGASAALYSTCVRWSLAHGFNHWATIVDQRIYEMMQSWGEPFIPFEGTDYAPYEGSKASIPVYTELNSGLERVRAFDEGIYRLYTESAGLDQQYVLPDIQ